MPELEPFGPIGIIAHTANEEFAESVSNILYQKRQKRYETNANPYVKNPGYLRSNYMMDSSLVRFQTGEGKFQLGESVRGHDIFIITDITANNLDMNVSGYERTFSPDDHYRDLLRIVSNVSGKARRVTVIMPFVYEGRTVKQDSSSESLDCAGALQQLYNLGVSNIIIFDPHDDRLANAVPLMGMDFPKCAYKIISTLLNTYDTVAIDKNKTMVVSPDESGVNRGIFYSSLMNLPLGIFYRDRDYTQKINGVHPIKDYKFLGDDVQGKDIIIIDDMINSGSTMLRTSRKLKEAGAKDIYCLSSFGLFTSGFEEIDKAYSEGIIKGIICTNLIYRSPELLSKEWYTDVKMEPYIAKIIDSLNVDESIYSLINSTTRITDLLSQVRLGELIDEFGDIQKKK